mmetsp:Transcript_12566/g.22657  ORF Transcript_12566/g.22657 Transcript_12566/m.22657 type:complete len:170 (-) Transcript_12566:457-966(-)|eukprot:CAMPEP_0182441222 /NCGR_PEP_ID=MMETSP1172-20130603/176_1 /TAXON_ID=708627 /ORGANISM="Timspurckia oligopyrenoides, Strain CCMP3278" /LENGTH=169 /DNA_ID=CAMNT_0024635395 /DNA_START=99 /DNA_END=608 /DNA_ORIENTATION=+
MGEGGLVELWGEELGELKRTSEKLGVRLTPAVEAIDNCVSHLDAVIKSAKEMNKPDDSESLDALFEPLVDDIEVVAEMKEGVSERDLLENHLVLLGDAIMGFGWVAEKNPIEYVQIVLQTTLSSSKPLRAKSEIGDPVHAEFADAVISLVEKLLALVTSEHPNGLKFKD